jgi:DMSO/TMAO reductase YedYZ molybdopterin-dependent catalytic subunit
MARTGWVIVGSMLAILAAPAWAADLQLTGPEGQSASLSAADVAALPHVKLAVIIEGKTTTYDGVPLGQLLARVGVPSGKALHGPALREVVLVSGRDGYAAAIALAETDPGFRKDQVILADLADGQPLGETVGPYRLVVEGDLRAARCVRMVTSIAVRAEK